MCDDFSVSWDLAEATNSAKRFSWRARSDLLEYVAVRHYVVLIKNKFAHASKVNTYNIL